MIIKVNACNLKAACFTISNHTSSNFSSTIDKFVYWEAFSIIAMQIYYSMRYNEMVLINLGFGLTEMSFEADKEITRYS